MFSLFIGIDIKNDRILRLQHSKVREVNHRDEDVSDDEGNQDDVEDEEDDDVENDVLSVSDMTDGDDDNETNTTNVPEQADITYFS